MPITEVKVPKTEFAILQWSEQGTSVQCFCDAPETLDGLFPIMIDEAIGWITARDQDSVTVQFHEPHETCPEQSYLRQEMLLVEPRQVMEQLNKFWLPLWQAEHDVNIHDTWPEFQNLMDNLPQPPRVFHFDNSLDTWMQAIKKIKAKSARGFDAVSAQELKQLPSQLIAQLSKVFDKYPKGLPTWIMSARVCPLNKVDNTPMPHQSRPICILSQIYRLYASVWCTQVLRYWATWFPMDITGMMPKRGSHTAAYSVQAELELARKIKQSLSGITLDIMKCFNCIRHQCGWRLLTRLGLPYHRVMQWFHSITQHAKYWEVGGECFGPYFSTCGFPEGDSHSVLVMLAVALLWCSNMKALGHDTLTTTAYADNWSWKTQHPADHSPAAQMTLCVTKTCGLTIDWAKTWLWATDTEVATQATEALKEQLPDQAVQRLHHSRDLGFELQYSGPHRIGHRQDRYDNAMRRLDRLATAHMDLSVKEHLVYTSIFPAGFYGAEIFPIAEDTLAKFRTAAADAIIGRAPSATPALVLLLTKPQILDPGFFVVAQAFRAAMLWLRGQTPETRHSFYACAATFTGMLRNVQGPASALKHYMSRFAWHLDKHGYVHVDTFIKVHLVQDSFPRLLRFLQLAWQQELVQTMTARHSLYSLPTISREDTLTVMKKISDKERLFLLKEVAGAYQLETQKQHWAEGASGSCPFCQETDGKTHRFAECPAFAEVRQPFQDLLRKLEDEGSHMMECPVVCVHPEAHVHRTLHFQQKPAEIADSFLDFALSRQSQGMGFHMYVDGSCFHPHSISTRYSAYAGVIDLCYTDAQRRHFAQMFLITGDMPNALQMMFAGRVQGEQTINRAESTALSLALQVPFGLVHTDSNFAINKLQTFLDDPDSSHHNTLGISHVTLCHQDLTRIRKIKAHRDPHAITDLLELYHVLGNMMADQAAKTTCANLHQSWQRELESLHEQCEYERDLLSEVYKLHLELGTARSAAAQQLTRLDDENIPANGKANLEPILTAFKNWIPGEIQPLTFPQNCEWFNFFSWGGFWQSNYTCGCKLQSGQLHQVDPLNVKWEFPG